MAVAAIWNFMNRAKCLRSLCGICWTLKRYHLFNRKQPVKLVSTMNLSPCESVFLNYFLSPKRINIWMPCIDLAVTFTLLFLVRNKEMLASALNQCHNNKKVTFLLIIEIRGDVKLFWNLESHFVHNCKLNLTVRKW